MKSKVLLLFNLVFFIGHLFGQSSSLLVYPHYNQIMPDTSVRLYWDTDTAYYNYRVQVSIESFFASPLIDTSLSHKNSLQISLNSNQSYYWRVAKFKPNTSIIWSSSSVFHTFSASDIDSLVLWLDARNGVTKDSNDKVSSWLDKSSFINNASQTNSIKQPLWVDSVIGDYPSISFVGTPSFLTGNYAGISPSNELRTIIILFKNEYVSGANSAFVNLNNGTDSYLFLECSYYQNKLRLWVGNGSSYSKQNLTGDYSNIVVSTMMFDSLGTNVYLNSTLTHQTSFPNRIDSLGHFGIGGRTYNNSSVFEAFNGHIFEIIDYAKPLDSSEIQLVNKYLLDKYTPPVCVGANILRKHSFCDTTISTWAMYESYLWNTGDTTRSINVARYDTGWYWCEVPNLYGDLMRDSVYVYNLVPEAGISDTTICLNSNSDVRLPFNSDYAFEWKNESGITVDNDSALQVSEAGRYIVKVTDSLGCFARDTVEVFVDSFALEADLGVDKQVCTGEKLSLISGQSKATQWSWNTNETDSVIVIDTAGTYVVNVTDIYGCVLQDSIDIGIKGISPTVGFKVDSTCLNSHSIFNDTSFTVDASSINSWTWDFGDGSQPLTLSTSQPFNHIFPDSGLYNVKLTATTDSGCVNYTYQNAYVRPLPVVSFTPEVGCSGHEIEFQTGSSSPHGQIIEWSYNFGDGTSPLNLSTSNPLTHIYNQPGSYNLKHRITSEYGCSDSIVKQVWVKPTPVADFAYSTSCEGEDIFFTEQNTLEHGIGLVERKWMLSASDSSTIPSPSIKFDTAGFYPVSYFMKASNGCWDTITKQVLLHGNPVAKYASDYICLNTPITLSASSSEDPGLGDVITDYRWEIETQGLSVQSDVPVLFNDTLNYNAKLKVTTNARCVDMLDTLLKVHPNPSAGFTVDKYFGLPPLSIQFTNQSSGYNQLTWDFGDGQVSNSENPVHTYTDSAVHWVVHDVQNQWGCKDSSMTKIYAIYATIDIAIQDIQVDLDNGYISYQCVLVNQGKRPVQTMWIEAGINNVYTLREKWEGNLEAGESMVYNFTAQTPIADIADIQYFCMQVEVIEDQADERLNNNSMCKEYHEELWFSTPYPNPADNEINIDFILPYKDQIQIRILAADGQQIQSMNIVGERGLNKLQIPTNQLSQGLYYLEIKTGETVEIKEFVK
jgi:PKD repeat protein